MSSLATVNLLNTNSVKYGSTNVKKIKLGYMVLWPANKQYVQHLWVEGNQAWIDTGIKPKWEWRYELKVRITSSTVLGNYNTFMESLNTLGYLIGIYFTNGKNVYVRCENDTVTPRIGKLDKGTTNVSAGHFMEYVIDPQNKYLKGVKKNSSGEVVESFDMTTGVIPQASGDMNNYNIHLFARSVNGTLNNQPIANAKIYYFKIYEANTDTLVHNFVPCHDTLNNKHGMIDTETGIFYQNANSTGSLTCGDDIIYYDWIRNTSPAYLNTGILPVKEYKYELKVKFHDNSTITLFFPTFGSVTEAPRYAVWGIKRNDRSLESTFYYNGTMYGLPARTTLAQLNDIAIHTVDVYNYTVSIQLYRNGTLVDLQSKTHTNVDIPSGNMSSYPIYLMSHNQSGRLDPDRNGKTLPETVYYFKVWDMTTGDLIHNFLPCWKEGVNGMMDTVTGNFITNANSSGTLTLGND